MFLSKSILSGLTVLTLVVTSVVTNIVGGATDGPVVYTQLPVNPAIAAQKTAIGKTIKDLLLVGDELYTGYGDYNINTGPINATSININTKQVTNHISLPGEEINNYKEVNGAIYAPNIDPKTPWNANTGYATNKTGAWTVDNVTPFIHVFDVASSDGEDLWLAGSISDETGKNHIGAAVKRSTDDGKTWTTERVMQSTPNRNDMDRNYWIEGVNGKIYTSSSSSMADRNGMPEPVMVWDNGIWTQVTNTTGLNGPTSGINTTVFKNKIVYIFANIMNIDTETNTINKSSQYLGNVYDFYVDGDNIYALTSQGIWVSTDAMKWGLLTKTLPTNASMVSIAVSEVNNKLWLGGADGKIFETNLNQTAKFPAVISGIKNVTTEAGAGFDLAAGVTAVDNYDGDITSKMTISKGTFGSDIAGVHTVYYSVQNSSGIWTTETRIVTVTPATTPSKPTLKAGAPIGYALEGAPYHVTAGVKATDTMDGDITDKIVVEGTVDTNVLGEHKVKFTVTNSHGLSNSLTLTVIVLKKSPTFHGVENATIFMGEPFDPLNGVTATDTFAGDLVKTFEGDISDKIVVTGEVDINTPGEYVLTYSATNVIQETTTVERKVTVKDNTPAVFKGIGDITVTVNKPFDPLKGVTVSDKIDGNITKNIKVTGKADTTKPGNYVVTYTVKNSHSVTTSVERKVTVVANTAPVIESNISLTLERDSVYNAQTAVTITDADKDQITNFTFSTNVNTNKKGTYVTTYMVTDSVGNTTTQQFTLTVK